MPFKKIKEYLPEFYHPFLPDFFEEEIPAESFTDCANCPMICSNREELGTDASRPFGPDTKCCTFTPYIPNYLAGALLSDSDSSLTEGKNRLREIIKCRKGIFPHGVYPTKKYSILYEHGKMHGFGKSIALKCPYFIPGKYNCSVWKYREAICSTWFCKHIAQNPGADFWEKMAETFRYVEESLSVFVLQQEFLDTSNPYGDDKNISHEDLDDLPPNVHEYTVRWGKWANREEEFYKHAYESVRALSKQQFDSILVIKLPVLIEAMKTSCAAMKFIPEILTPNLSRTITEVIPGTYRLEIDTWIERSDTTVTHAFDLPKIIIDSFDGKKSTESILTLLKNNHKIELGKDILIALVRHGILIVPE
jgi:hypothetical protein